jgi:DNA-binding MarR family transcriptional regulator
VSDQSKRDQYTKDRLDWIDQVMADRDLPASASKVGYVIATSLWRTKGTVTLVTPEITASDQVREAWIGTRDIADKIGMSRFTVMKMVDRLEAQGHLEVDRGTQGRGHSNHYRLVRKGAQANLLERKQTKLKGAHASLLDGAQAKPKGARANLSDREKVSPHTSRGAPTHLNPFVPTVELPSEKRGAPQARPDADALGKSSIGGPESLKSPLSKMIDVESSGVAIAPPPDHLERGFEHKSKQERWQGKVIDQDGVEYEPPPPHQRRPVPKTWMDAAFEGYNGGRS